MSGLYQYCLEPGCSFTSHWHGGPATEDPAIPHLEANPDHVVRSGAREENQELYRRQKSGELDVTRRVVDAGLEHE